jgi:hypothetical protein
MRRRDRRFIQVSEGLGDRRVRFRGLPRKRMGFSLEAIEE